MKRFIFLVCLALTGSSAWGQEPIRAYDFETVPGTVVGSVGQADGRSAAAGKALSLTGGYIIIEELPTLPAYSYSLWIRPDRMIANQYVISMPVEGGEPVDELYFADGQGLFSRTFGGYYSPVLFTRWNHVALTHDGVMTKIYVNGDLYLEGTNPAPRTTAYALQLGGSLRVADDAFYGLIDDFKLWDRALSDIEVQEDAQIEKPAYPPPILASGMAPEVCVLNSAILGSDAQCDDHVAQLRKNGWVPSWRGWVPRLPDRVKRMTSTTPDRIYWGWQKPETSCGECQFLTWHQPWPSSLNWLTVNDAIKKGLTTTDTVYSNECDDAFLWGTAEQMRDKCAVTYDVSTQTAARVYAYPALTTVIGTLPKGQSCAAYSWLKATTTSRVHWYRLSFNGVEAAVRCKDVAY